MNELKIGFNAKSYLETRNIIGICKNHEYKRIYDFYFFKKLGANLIQKVKRSSIKNDYKFQFKSTKVFEKIDLYHFFNCISYSKTPWITTFETLVPRFQTTMTVHSAENPDYGYLTGNAKVLAAVKRLASEECKKLIALSHSSKEIQLDFIKNFPEYRDQIEKKLCVMHPPQRLFISGMEDKGLSYSGELRFIFVGASFHRKGGAEMLRAFKKIYGKFQFKLVIVSSLRIDNYATKETEADIVYTRNFLRENNAWIEYYETLPNRQVMELMKGCHIGLLPTWADSYGFSVLEFQASGCPVISTNIRVLPEINNNEVGWMIEVPKNRLGEGRYLTPQDRASMSKIIEEGLITILEGIFENRKLILPKGEKALKQIAKNHDLIIFEKEINKIYQEALV